MRVIVLLLIILHSIRGEASAQLTYNELRVDYDSSWIFKNLQLIPIRFKQQEKDSAIQVKQKTLGLTEAMAYHKIKVQEMQYENGADVNWLQVTNHSKQHVLLQAGEIVAGGKQDRMIAETKLVAPGSTDYIHVFCVEKRRWDSKPKPFTHFGMANNLLRKSMDISARQADVWKEIDKQFAKDNKKSETWSYRDLYKDAPDADTGYVKYFLSRYKECERNLAGFIFITGNKVMSVELFSSPGYLDITYENMLSTYIQSAALSGEQPYGDNSKVKILMDKVIMNAEAQKAYVQIHGQIHLQDNKIIHLIAYP